MYREHRLMELMRETHAPPLRAHPTTYRSLLLTPLQVQNVLRKCTPLSVVDGVAELSDAFIESCLQEARIGDAEILTDFDDLWKLTYKESEYSFKINKRDWASMLVGNDVRQFSTRYGHCVASYSKISDLLFFFIPLITIRVPLATDVNTFTAIHKADRVWRTTLEKP